jgi:hypothetical protein
MNLNADEQIKMIRSILRKDLDSVGMLPSGIAIQLIASSNGNMAMALMLEAVYIQMFNGRDLKALRDYLLGPIRVNPEMVDYLIKSAFRVRDALAPSKGDGKIALTDLMNDKGAEVELIKLSLTTCYNVSKEFKVPFDKKLAIQDEFSEFKKLHPMSCVVMSIVLIAIFYGIYKLIRWAFI